jgi:hypothetical protein
MAVIGELTAAIGFVPYAIPQTIVRRGQINRRELESVEPRHDSYFDVFEFAKTIEEAMYISAARLAHMFFYLPTSFG